MDCGPVALWSLLTGLGIQVSYDSLREACRTGVDGTSIRALEAVLQHFGLAAQQIVAPKEHLGHPAAKLLPAIAVTRQSGGAMHFVLLWRRRGRRIEVMDPASGRRLLTAEQLAQELYAHPVEVEAGVWRRLALSGTAQAVLTTRLHRLGLRASQPLLQRCEADPSWRPIAALEAAARLVEGLVQSRALPRGRAAAELCERLFEAGCQWQPGQPLPIPGACWSALSEIGPKGPTDRLRTRGALLLNVSGWRPESDVGSASAGAELPGPPNERTTRGTAAPASTQATQATHDGDPSVAAEPRKTYGAAALAHLAPAPTEDSLPRRLLRLLSRADRALLPGLVLQSVLAGGLVLLQALCLRALLDLPIWLVSWSQRLWAGLLLAGLGALVLAIELGLTERALDLGRRLEARLRMAVQQGLPRLPGRWFGTRPASDLAERAHSLSFLHDVPLLMARVVRCATTLLFTGMGLIWLDPGRAGLVLILLVAALWIPYRFGRGLSEKELRVRGHQGALVRLYLEALCGLVAVRVHGAERALRREHESLLVEWTQSGQALARASLGLKALSSGVLTLLALLLVAWHLSSRGAQPAALLFGYWALTLPALGEQLAQAVLLAAPLGNAARRALEPIDAGSAKAEPGSRQGSAALDHASTAMDPSTPGTAPAGTHPLGWPAAASELRAAGATSLEPASAAREQQPSGNPLRLVRDPTPSITGLRVEFRGVCLELGGRGVLEGVDLTLEPGEHLALLGRSGAGKSSLLALLLGLEQPSSGAIQIDGAWLDASEGQAERPESVLAVLRRQTAWVDPAVQLWNQSAFENLLYGRTSVSPEELVASLEAMETSELVARLPEGLSTRLGEGGTRLSGGEGQRVRLARAWLRGDARLVLLDEPFRGLERSRRKLLLERLRARFRDATLITVTHDVESALDFPRVAVLDGGRLVEQGVPQELAAQPGSHLSRLLAAEQRLRQVGYGDLGWRRFWVADGRLEERR
jgi:ABC-type multidrug transport system fused ATPase/permease subunit